MAREAAERVVVALPWENVCADIVGTPSLEILDDRQSDGTNGFALLTILQPQAARLDICLRPFQADHLATPRAGQRNLTNDIDDRCVSLLLGSIAEHPTKYSVLCLRESPLSDIVLWLADAMDRVAFNDAGVDSVGKDAAEADQRYAWPFPRHL